MEIGSKEGWRALVDARVEKPELLTMDAFKALPEDARLEYNDTRIRYGQEGAFISTPQFRYVKRAVRERMVINAHRTVGKLGVILSGEPGQGKTTTLMQIGKEHELRRRATGHPVGAVGNIPVVYVAVPAQCSAKELLHEFARFLALPRPGGATYGRLVEMVAHALRECSTELVLVDDIHHLDLRYRQNIEASDMLKQSRSGVVGPSCTPGSPSRTRGCSPVRERARSESASRSTSLSPTASIGRRTAPTGVTFSWHLRILSACSSSRRVRCSTLPANFTSSPAVRSA